MSLLLPSPYVMLAAGGVLVAASIGSGIVGYRAGADHWKAVAEKAEAGVKAATIAEMSRQQEVAAAAMRDAIARSDAAEAEADIIKKKVDDYAKELAASGDCLLSDDDSRRLSDIIDGRP